MKILFPFSCFLKKKWRIRNLDLSEGKGFLCLCLRVFRMFRDTATRVNMQVCRWLFTPKQVPDIQLLLVMFFQLPALMTSDENLMRSTISRQKRSEMFTGKCLVQLN